IYLVMFFLLFLFSCKGGKTFIESYEKHPILSHIEKMWTFKNGDLSIKIFQVAKPENNDFKKIIFSIYNLSDSKQFETKLDLQEVKNISLNDSTINIKGLRKNKKGRSVKITYSVKYFTQGNIINNKIEIIKD
ncbi:hypothetical protein J7L48_08710, partial [bacterium]|nr:hypothetical protein [bacterium]